MVKKNMHRSAEIFAQEANVGQNPVAINEQNGFLIDWWTIFWNLYSSTGLGRPDGMGIPFVELSQMMGNQLQNMVPLVSIPEMNPQMGMQFPMNTNFDNLLGQPAANPQIGMQAPMNTNFDNLLGQPKANQPIGMQFPMITNFDNLQGQPEANQLISMQFPMNTNFYNLQGQPEANQPIGMQFPMNTNFDNLQGQPAANQPIGMQFSINTNFDNLQGQPVANQRIHMHFDNLQGQPVANQRIGMQLPMSTNFDSLQGQPAENQPIGMQFPMNAYFNNLQGQPAASLLSPEIYGGEHSTLPVRDVNPYSQNLHADKLSLSKASSSNARDHNQCQQPISQNSHERTTRDKNCMGRTYPLDSTQMATLPRAGQYDAGMEKGANPMLLRGWPSTGADQMPSLSYPVLNALMPGKNLHQSSFRGNTGNLDNLMQPTNGISGTDGQVVPGRQTAEQQMTDPMRRNLEQKMMANIRQVEDQQQKDQLVQQQQLHEMMVPGRQTAQQQNMVPMRQASQQKSTVPMIQTAERQKKKQSMEQQLHESNGLVINQMMVPGRQTTHQQSMVPMRETLEQGTTVPGRQFAEQQQKDQLMQQHLNEMMVTGRQIAAQLVVAPMQQTVDPKMMVPVGQIGQQQQMDQQMKQQLNEMMVPGRQTSGQKKPAPLRHFAQQQQNDQMLQKQLQKIMMPGRQTAEKQMMVPTTQNVEQNMMVTERQSADRLTLQPPSEDENSRKRKSPANSQAEGNALGGKDLELEMPTDDDIESFLLHDDGNADNVGTSLIDVQEHVKSTSIKDPHSPFTFEEAGFLNPSKGKILCCSFSTDGKILASAGQDKKVSLWNTKTFDNVYTGEEHSRLITDVRFKLNSRIFATSSFDKTVQIWDANKPSKSVYKLIGHAGPVTSLDFHTKNVDILASCDTNDEIRLWNVKQCACVHILKGGSKQVRFQPRYGKYLIAASGNKVHLIDAETQVIQHVLEGHVKEVKAICWEPCGKYYASLSEDSARVWSTAFGAKCIHVLHSSPGLKFESCTFHPAYAQLMIIGCYQVLNVWNPTEKEKIMPVPDAHNSIISALTECIHNDMVGSASHDRCVKLWK
ncbi:transcriptional corepressor LEUNIG_HOMOLOG-like [Actinidia eriantha]|uniref:transcriptional corepressor LEUNIG_HOMOLOG-like n=1 Tax=Actinidia eriantha TaxID=165200 RepID=UPI00258E3412|nr:transcriptional corepressor LEUNIG_HOMOLOG-like [Actinidia eriantha]